MLYIFLAFISGFLVIISMIINSHLAKKIGVFQGTFINYAMGLLFSAIILLLTGSLFDITFETLTNIPLWAFFGGIIGVAVVSISNVIVPKIPVIYTTLLVFVGQLIAGILLDYFYGSSISKGKLIGGAFIIAGLVYNFTVDKKYITKNRVQTAKLE